MKHKDLDTLFTRPARNRRCVLSVYLSVDQSDPANLNRGFETELKRIFTTQLESLPYSADRDGLSVAAKRVTDFVSKHKPEGRGLAVFSDESDGFFWHKDLAYTVSNEIRWGREPLLQPLANALDELEDYGVVLVDRAKARLLLAQLGEIEEHLHLEGDGKHVRHVKSTGSDRAESSGHMQRKADNQVRANLRDVVQAVEEFVKRNEIRRLVLAGTPETIAELRKLLPARIDSLVIGELPLGMNVSAKGVLAATEPVVHEYERRAEVQRVNEVVTASAKTDKAVVGLDSTLQAVNSGRVWELIYSEGLLSPGFECPECSALFSNQTQECLYCGADVQPVRNIVEQAVEHALRKQARIEVVTGEASTALAAAGGIGAFLKTRPKAAAVS